MVNDEGHNFDFKLLSFNVKGIRDGTKRNAVFEWLQIKKADIYLLQETHSAKDDESSWNRQWGNNAIYSHGTNHSKGVAIFFNPKLDYQIIEQIVDENGRFILININIKGT